MIYLSSPYSHPDPVVRAARFGSTCRLAAMFESAGDTVYSPVIHGDATADYDVPGDHWRPHREMLEACDDVVVLVIDGWEESTGLQAEIDLAEELGKPVLYMVCVCGPGVAA